MNIKITVTTTILILLLNVGDINGLSMQQNSSSSVNVTSHGSFEHNGKTDTIIQAILNQTTDLETLKSTQLLLNHIVEFENYISLLIFEPLLRPQYESGVTDFFKQFKILLYTQALV